MDLTGQRFGRLTVIRLNNKKQRFLKSGSTQGFDYYWLCKCDCEKECIVQQGHLKNGHTQSCGCLGKERRLDASTKHGQRRTNLYDIWTGMKQRCYNPKSTAYKDYGGRGIKMCEEWKNDFQSFYDWAILNNYQEGLSIERIDVNGDYCIKNCKWIGKSEQAKNRRNTLYVNYNGKQIRLADFAKQNNFEYNDFRRIYLENNKDLNKTIEICNLHKKGLMSTNTSGYRGVSYNKKNKNWIVRYKGKWYGTYSSKEEAINVSKKIIKD